MAVASLVLGIVGLVLSFFSFGILGIIGIILGIIGIILGALGRKDPEKKGIATAGLVLSIICVAINVIVLVACIGCAAIFADAAEKAASMQ